MSQVQVNYSFVLRPATTTSFKCTTQGGNIMFLKSHNTFKEAKKLKQKKTSSSDETNTSWINCCNQASSSFHLYFYEYIECYKQKSSHALVVTHYAYLK